MKTALENDPRFEIAEIQESDADKGERINKLNGGVHGKKKVTEEGYPTLVCIENGIVSDFNGANRNDHKELIAWATGKHAMKKTKGGSRRKGSIRLSKMRKMRKTRKN
jgi:hypothetical protein